MSKSSQESSPIIKREYVIADKPGEDAYWFERGFPTLELARREANKYPAAKVILEYRPYRGLDGKYSGVVPTGKQWEAKHE